MMSTPTGVWIVAVFVAMLTVAAVVIEVSAPRESSTVAATSTTSTTSTTNATSTTSTTGTTSTTSTTTIPPATGADPLTVWAEATGRIADRVAAAGSDPAALRAACIASFGDNSTAADALVDAPDGAIPPDFLGTAAAVTLLWDDTLTACVDGDWATMVTTMETLVEVMDQ